jgi:heme/copper-type cytochrome/quinol oxidase subunit 3
MAATPTPTVTARRRPGNAAQLGSLLAATAGFMFMATLCGAYISVRNWRPAGTFIPESMKFDHFAGFMMMTSALIGSLAVEWALSSIRLKQRRWGTAGYGIAIVFMAATANSAWFIGQQARLVASDERYAIMLYAILAGVILLVGIGALAAGVSLVRVMSGHTLADDILYGRAGNWLVHLASLGAVTAFFLLFTYK